MTPSALGQAFLLPEVEEKEGDIRGQLRRLEVDANRSAPALVKYPTVVEIGLLERSVQLAVDEEDADRVPTFQLAVPLGKRCWP